MSKERDIWIDNVKIVACILVVLGHFFQSLVKAEILTDSSLYNWFNSTIYCFHVPLFFICSGFLYQKYSIVRSLAQWKTGMTKKMIALGIPYLVFSFTTWILKKIFSSAVNSQIAGLGYTLIKDPVSPYWYLYILFIIFAITLTINSKFDSWFLLILSLICKLLVIAGFKTNIVAIDKTAGNWIWFVAGMLIAESIIPFLNKILGAILLFVFFIGSIMMHLGLLHFNGIEFIFGIAACYSIISIIYNISERKQSSKTMRFLAKYTMPVFLMHTLFAAPLRSILVKLGTYSAFIHITLGLFISFAGPVIAMIIMEKLKPLDFIIYPNKYIKIKSGH